MRLLVRSKGLELSDDLRDFTEDRLRFALGRFGQRIKDVRVQLTDINGPRGGEDVDCRVEATLMPSGSLRIRDLDSDAFKAVARASDRLGTRMARHLERRRAHRRRA